MGDHTFQTKKELIPDGAWEIASIHRRENKYTVTLPPERESSTLVVPGDEELPFFEEVAFQIRNHPYLSSAVSLALGSVFGLSLGVSL